MAYQHGSNKLAIAIIQARSSSSRLPGKVLKPLAGKPMIWHIVERARACRLVGKVVVATSTEPSDDELAEFCRDKQIDCFRGSLTNVLSRYVEVLRLDPHEYVVRITGDCPLIHPPFIDRQIEVLAENDADMVWVRPSSSLLEGQGVHSSRSIREVAWRSNHHDDLEHVGARLFSESPEVFRNVGLEIPAGLGGRRWRITVDEEEDYMLMKDVYEALYKGFPIRLQDAVNFLKANPSIAIRNSKIKESAVNRDISVRRAQSIVPLLTTAQW